MNKIALTSLVVISIAAPAMGAVGDLKITKTASSAPCTNTTLDTPTGPAALEADWTANRITINWDAKNGTTITPTECTYDSTITLPTTPSKTGYTFGGWTVAVSGGGQNGGAQCSLSGLDTDTDGIDFLSKNFAGDNCYYYNEDTGEDFYDDCSDNTFSGLSAGEWQTNFSYGSVKGTAYCSAKSGNNHKDKWGGDSSDWTATESELTSATGDARYCWCKVTGYTPNGGDMCVPAASSWVFQNDLWSPSYCADDCVKQCGDNARFRASHRAAIFGQ